MEKYIKAIEKEIIKEVVLYKDEVIAKAKEIAGVGERGGQKCRRRSKR